MAISKISQAGLDAPISLTSPTLTTPNIDSAQIPTVSGTAPLYMCRAWVNFNGTGTVAIRGSGNVTSITDNGTGDYRVNFTTSMSDTNYSTVGLTVGQASQVARQACIAPSGSLTGSVQILTGSTVSAGLVDVDTVCVSVFR